MRMSLSPAKLHDEEIKKLQNCLFTQKENKTALCLAKKATKSNTTRSSSYKQKGLKIDVDHLNDVLAIDSKKLTCLCQPRISMQALARETLKQGLIPLVMPEFKGITVGGAIMGCGGESSSHHYGLFHDICSRHQMLLGSGEIVWASESEHSDLFHGLTGSYGSLGLLLASEFRLQKAQNYVNLTYHRYQSADEALTKMRELLHEAKKPEFLEGILFSHDHGVVIEGTPSDTPHASIYRDSAFAPWFYQHAKSVDQKVSLPLYDYLFRYDRGAFWMGSYVISPPILARVFAEGVWKIKKSRPFNEKEILRFSTLKDPNLLMRLFSAPFTSSQTLYSVLHTCEAWVQERFMVQDFTLPEENIASFLDRVDEVSPIWPIWLCPVKNSKEEQLFSPHANSKSRYSINAGVYGLPKSSQSLFECLKALEKELTLLNGRKWLYSHSTYSPEEFWQIYHEAPYRQLRDKYHANGVWLSIEDKVLSS